MTICQIVCVIINPYHPRLIRDTGYDDEMAGMMLERANKKNALETSLDDNKFQKILKWTKMKGIEAAPDFPKLSQAQLEELTLSVFQLKQAKSYTNEHINDDGCYEIMISTPTNGLLRAKIQSRHFNRKAYNAIVQYNKSTILEWCCQCPYGNVTIGCCSHVASVIWYLSLARYDYSKMKQLSGDYIEFFKDASAMLSSEDDDDDDDNDDDGDLALYSLS